MTTGEIQAIYVKILLTAADDLDDKQLIFRLEKIEKLEILIA